MELREISERFAGIEGANEVVSKFLKLRSAQAATVRIFPIIAFRDTHFWEPFWPYDNFHFFRDSFQYLRNERDNSYFLRRLDEIERRNQRLDPNEIESWDDVESNWSKLIDTLDLQIPKQPIILELHLERGRLRDAEGDLEKAMAIASEAPLLTLVDVRGECRMQFTSGDQVWSGGRRGVIGGFVTDGTNQFGVTCGHVAVGSKLTDHSGVVVATTTATEQPVPMPSGGVCDPTPRAGTPSVTINAIDAAIVSMSTSVKPMSLSLIGSLRQAERLSVQARSGRLDFTVRSVAIAMSVKSGSSASCFSPLVEMYPDTGTTNAGDSGAWGLKNAGSEWATMVIGADSVSTFGTDARDIHQWIESSSGLGRPCTIF